MKILVDENIPRMTANRLRQPNRRKIHVAVKYAMEHIRDSEWPSLLMVMRDTTMSTSRAGGPVEK